jgi:G3E family GTPase
LLLFSGQNSFLSAVALLFSPFFVRIGPTVTTLHLYPGENVTKTNLITGFLGSGKTTSILHLLAHKPADEKWAVLVNEFGEVGIDGALLADSGALLKEIPGGCMCCVNGLPMQVGLNTLLRQGKPDRLLIEPTGLGHPKQILDILTAAVYEPWIDLRATLCVLDPRQLLDSKVMANDNFRDQLAAADVIISNKTDRMTAESEQAFDAWWQEHAGERLHIGATHGNIDPKLLDLPRLNLAPLPESAEHAHSHGQKKGLAALSLPAHQRWRRSLNSGQGYQPAAGSLMPIRPLIRLACLSGLVWRRLPASKA